MNSDFADIATALTGSVASNGVTAITGQLKSSVVSSPAYSSSADATTGFGSSTAGEADIWASGTIIVQVTSAGATVDGNAAVTGNLVVDGSVTAASFNFSGTGAIEIPSGTTAQRPASPAQGDIRYNSTNGNFEGYDGAEWDIMSLINQSYTLSASVSAGLLTVNFLNALTGAAPTAADPVAITFRDPTLTTGDTVAGLVTAALSINTNGIGATLGSQNGVPFRLWIIACYNGGTPVLALRNCSTVISGVGNIYRLPEFILHNTFAIGSAATSPGVFYTPNGVDLTNTPIKILGYVEYASGLTTAGNYASGPTTIQLFGLGIPRPGERVQLQSGKSTTSTSIGTDTQTSLSAAISPSSSANPIFAQADVNWTSGAANAEFASAQLSRGTSPTYFGNKAETGSSFISGGSTSVSSPLRGFDLPGTTSSTTYYVYMTVVNGGATFNSYTAPLYMYLEEIMG